MSFCRNAIVFLAAALCSIPQGRALDPHRTVSQYSRNWWGPETGYQGGAVHDIAQTRDGYLWIVAETGLFRFDGLKFHHLEDPAIYNSLDTQGIGLVIADGDKPWLRLRNLALQTFENGAFHPGPGDLTVTAMVRARNGGLLATPRWHGLVLQLGPKFETLIHPDLLPRSPVISIAETESGEIWLGTREEGLLRFQGGSLSTITKGLPGLKINCLLPAGNGELWIGTDQGIAFWNGTSVVIPKAVLPVGRIPVNAMREDRDNNIWFGTANGLSRLNSHGLFTMESVGRRADQAVTAVFEDREGNLWAGRNSGIERVRDSAFVTYSTAEGLPSDSNGSVYSDVQGRTWMAPSDGGLYWFRDGTLRKITAMGLENDVVYSIAGQGESLWIGRQRGGLTQLRMDGDAARVTTYTVAHGLAENVVYSVSVSKDGTVWAGTLNGGVSRLQNGVFTTFTSKDGLASNSVNATLEATDGTMWFATPSGLSALSQGRWRTLTTRDGLPADNVNCLLEDPEHVLWVGTVGGLGYLRSGRLQVPRLPQLQGQILGIAADGYGGLWIALSNRVVRVSRQKLIDGSLTPGDTREFELVDGLHSNVGIKRNRSVVADSRGRIWFSMARGISVVDPGRLAESAPTMVHITKASADGDAFDLRQPFRIPPGRQRIEFGFEGLTLSNPEQTRFRYRLDGFDHNWTESTASREAVYPNLSPGPYRFHVIATDSNGVWNSADEEIAFNVAPALWQTWQFQSLSAFALILVVTALYRVRTYQLTTALNVRFEERLKERTRIAQELHDTLLQGLLAASMKLGLAIDQLDDESPVKPALGGVHGLMARVIDEGRNTVRGLRLSVGGTEDLEKAFCRIREEMPVRDGTEFRVVVEGKPKALHPVLRDEVYRIGREAVSNALRHSGALRIEVELEYAAREFRILVRDNGCGIDPDILKSGREGHWGLTGMRERAERIGARLKLWSGAGAGTEVALSVPNHVAYSTDKRTPDTT